MMAPRQVLSRIHSLTSPLWHGGLVLLCGAAFPRRVPAQKPEGTAVQVQMRHTDFRVDSNIVLRIAFLRGELRRTDPDHSPYLDDKTSFLIRIDSAAITIAPASLGDLLNRHTFGYPGSPLRHLKLSVEKAQVRQEGTMRGISFTIVGDLTLTPKGELHLHPNSIKAAGIGVGGLMKLFGLHLDKLVKLRGARGVRVEKDELYLNPAELLPPPRARGQVSSVEVTDTAIALTFQPTDSGRVQLLKVPQPEAPNYMFFRGGVLRFGKLTMHDADLMIVDAQPQDPFDFFPDHYNAQLVSGVERSTPDNGLVVYMPDFKRTPPLPRKALSRGRKSKS